MEITSTYFFCSRMRNRNWLSALSVTLRSDGSSQPTSPAIQDAMATVELRVAHGPEFGGSCLRLRSFYTGSTYWQHGWDGSEATALAFMEEMAELQGANVSDDRRHGPTLWDHVQRKP